MNPFMGDPISPTAAVVEEAAVKGSNKIAQMFDESFKNLTVKDIVGELSTVAAFEYEYDDELSLESYTPVAARVETFVMAAVLGLIFIVGVLGNGTLIAIFLRHRGMRNIPNTYIFSLALADLLVIIICVPLAIMVYTTESSPLGSTLCRLSEFAKDISVGVSVFTLTALAAERYCAIVNPLRKLHTKPLTVFTALMIWLLAIICALPVAIRSDEQMGMVHGNNSIMYCTPFGPEDDPLTPLFRKYITVARAVIYYFLPLSIIGILYALMARRLHLSAREMPGELPMQSQQARARRHVARMVVTFVIVFIICFLPHHIFMLWFHLNPEAEDQYDQFWHVLRMVGISFGFLNSCANPVALYCVSGVFRQHFHRYLCCKPMISPNRLLGHSTATNVCDTSFTSTMRRNTIKSHGGGGVGDNGHNITNGNSIKLGSGGGGGCVVGLKINGSDNNSYWHQNSGRVDSGAIRKNSSPTQNIITMEKR